MSQYIFSQEGADSSWKSLYKLGGVAALIAIPIFIIDIAISFGGGDTNPDFLTVTEFFMLFQDNWLLALRMLGLINIISLTATIPMYYAIYAAHIKAYKAYGALSLILYFIGMAVYISNNSAIPMMVLSNKYLAASDAYRTVLEAAGEALVAKGADFTPGSFIGFFFTEIAGIAFSCIMLKGKLFSRAVASLGIIGFVLLSSFTIVATFIPDLFDTAMILAMIGGLTSLAWYLLVGMKLLKLGSCCHTK